MTHVNVEEEIKTEFKFQKSYLAMTFIEEIKYVADIFDNSTGALKYFKKGSRYIQILFFRLILVIYQTFYYYFLPLVIVIVVFAIDI